MSLPLIENLFDDAIDFRQVNSGVRRLRIQIEVMLNQSQRKINSTAEAHVASAAEQLIAPDRNELASYRELAARCN